MNNDLLNEIVEQLYDICESIKCLTKEIDHLRDDIREYNDNRP